MSDNETKAGTRQQRKFSDFFAEHANGRDNDQATQLLAELVQQVHLLEKPGKLTITLSVSAANDVVAITPKIVVAMPPEPLTGKFYFVGEDGFPTRRDPNQPELFDDDV